MFDKLNATASRYDQIGNMLTEPDVTSDNERYKALMKEYKALTPIVEKYREY
ncbi:MAG: PCRF domain-containing protein, partial [Angelakisella sp.]